jgi:GDP-4-dehydro-6-deoxy-D-mannose reductase
MSLKILITGINGFIGSFLAEYLLSDIEDVKVFGTVKSMQNLKNIKHIIGKVHLKVCDIRDKNAVRKIVENVKPDIVFHLAAQSSPFISWKEPTLTFEVNIMGSLFLLESIRNLGLNPTIIMACSSAEYGNSANKFVPLKENVPLLPLSPYAVSKVCQDLLAYQYYKNFGMKIVRARIFGTIGPRKEGDVCSDFAKQIVNIELGLQPPKLLVGNLEVKRDFTDVRDTVKALWLLAEKGEIGDVYNICSGQAYKIKDILVMFVKMADCKTDISIEVDPQKLRPSDENIIIGDNSKIRSKCGWSPKIRIDESLRDILDFWRKELK